MIYTTPSIKPFLITCFWYTQNLSSCTYSMYLLIIFSRKCRSFATGPSNKKKILYEILRTLILSDFSFVTIFRRLVFSYNLFYSLLSFIHSFYAFWNTLDIFLLLDEVNKWNVYCSWRFRFWLRYGIFVCVAT